MFLIDANVLLDARDETSPWRAWSIAKLEEALKLGPCVINAVIYAECAASFADSGEASRQLAGLGAVWADLKAEAAYIASRAFKLYRARGGVKRSPLPDFFIGAHAEAEGWTVLTRDPRPYRTYFPGVPVIAPMDPP